METIKINTILKTTPSELEVSINTYKWTTSQPKGVIIISHGMAEHAKRYEEFATKLTEVGFIVYAPDHIGHGLTCGSPELVGKIPGKNFIQTINEGIKAVYTYAKGEYPELPFYIFSHSMGSMATQDYIQTYPNDFEKVIFCGTDKGSFKYLMASILAKIIMKVKGELYISEFVHNLGVGAFDKAFKDEPALSWLSLNKQNIENYKNDPYCGAKFPVNYYYSIAKTLCKAVKSENIKLVKAQKVLFICGEQDPVTGFTKSPIALDNLYKNLGINSSAIIFKNARHEILNEDENVKNEVYKEIINFYLS